MMTSNGTSSLVTLMLIPQLTELVLLTTHSTLMDSSLLLVLPSLTPITKMVKRKMISRFIEIFTPMLFASVLREVLDLLVQSLILLTLTSLSTQPRLILNQEVSQRITVSFSLPMLIPLQVSTRFSSLSLLLRPPLVTHTTTSSRSTLESRILLMKLFSQPNLLAPRELTVYQSTSIS